MGDISEMRGLIVVGCFLFMASFLIAGIYSDLGYSAESKRQMNIPEYFEGLDLGSYTVTYNNSVPQDGIENDKTWNLGGYNWIIAGRLSTDVLRVGINRYWWIFWVGTQWLYFKNTEGIDRGAQLTRAILDADFDVTEGQVKYKVFYPTDPKVGCDIYFGFNVSLYDWPSEAWENGTAQNSDLKFLQGIGLEQIATTYNAWNIIGQILFFQMPETHWIVKAILAAPIWIAMAYTAFILVLRAVGAIFGGGA